MADEQTVRCFVGIPVAPAFVAAVQPVLARLQSQASVRKVRWVKPHNWHLTLAFLGDQTLAFVQELQAGLRTALQTPSPGTVIPASPWPAAGLSRYTLTGRWICGFPDAKSRIIALEFHPSPQLLQGKAILDGVLRQQGFEPERRALRPHLTLGRVRREQRVHFDPVLCEAALPVQELTLFKSTLTAEGSEYESLWTLPLSG